MRGLLLPMVAVAYVLTAAPAFATHRKVVTVLNDGSAIHCAAAPASAKKVICTLSLVSQPAAIKRVQWALRWSNGKHSSAHSSKPVVRITMKKGAIGFQVTANVSFKRSTAVYQLSGAFPGDSSTPSPSPTASPSPSPTPNPGPNPNPTPPPTGQTFYVDPAGNDANDGSSTRPWRTLQHAADTVRPGSTGVTVEVRPGHYQGFNISNGGTSDTARVVFYAEPGAIIDTPAEFGGWVGGINSTGKSFLTIQGFTIVPAANSELWDTGIRNGGTPGSLVRGNQVIANTVHMRSATGSSTNTDQLGIFCSYNDGWDVENNDVSGSWDSGIYASNSTKNYRIVGNLVHGVGGNGIHNNGAEEAPGINTNAFIAANVIYDVGFGIGGQAISCDGMQNSVIENNLIYDAHAKGISLYVVNSLDSSDGNLVTNNTIVMAADASGPAMRVPGGNRGEIIRNNIFINQKTDINSGGAYPYSIDDGTGFTIDNNAVAAVLVNNNPRVQIGVSLDAWHSSGFDKHGINTTSSALFTNAATADFTLKAGSPAIDAGTSQTAPSSDLAGKPRPHGAGFDIGVYEAQ